MQKIAPMVLNKKISHNIIYTKRYKFYKLYSLQSDQPAFEVNLNEAFFSRAANPIL